MPTSLIGYGVAAPGKNHVQLVGRFAMHRKWGAGRALMIGEAATRRRSRARAELDLEATIVITGSSRRPPYVACDAWRFAASGETFFARALEAMRSAGPVLRYRRRGEMIGPGENASFRSEIRRARRQTDPNSKTAHRERMGKSGVRRSKPAFRRAMVDATSECF